ncbi:hypothetical protein R4B61_01210 [Fructilactobacillus vespulae]|uniref:hypothetical protein n=1 Tax=Fructilactobacillus vespulae TaxID=1249630 RepID=UPI0039B6BD90
MKNINRLLICSLGSLVWLLGINYLMQLTSLGFTPSATFARTSIMAVLLFAVPLLLMILKIRVGLYFLMLVQLIYSVGYLNGIYNVATLNSVATLVKLVVIGLIVLGFLLNLIWFIIAWQYRKEISAKQVERYMKYRK